MADSENSALLENQSDDGTEHRERSHTEADIVELFAQQLVAILKPVALTMALVIFFCKNIK